MNTNKWTMGLAALGVVSLASVVNAEEKLNAVQTALSATTINGYVNASAWWNPNTSAAPGQQAAYPGIPLSYQKQDGFNLDAVKIGLEKPLDESQWAAGYKVDIVYGADAVALNTFGNSSDFALQNAFIALRAPVGNGIDFKFGVFDSIIGYETFAAGNNPNYTRSYGWGLEPTTLTGALATYKVTDWLSVAGGIANTYGPSINQKAQWASGTGNNVYGAKAESYKTYTGSIALSAPQDWGWLGGSALYAGAMGGFNSALQGVPNNQGVVSGGDQHNFYVGGTINTPIKAVKVGASYDYAGSNGGQSLWANAGSGYISWQVMEKLTIFGRGEYSWRDSALAVGPGATFNAQNPGVIPAKVIAGTVTVQYDLWENVLSRLEFRWDHDATGGVSYSSANNGYLKNAYMLALNLIYRF